MPPSPISATVGSLDYGPSPEGLKVFDANGSAPSEGALPGPLCASRRWDSKDLRRKRLETRMNTGGSLANLRELLSGLERISLKKMRISERMLVRR